MNKLIRDGKVGVLYSPGFGAGWYSWNTEYPQMVFDPEIIAAVENKDLILAEKIAEERYPNAYIGGLRDLEVSWLNEGDQFEINEYDGSESIHVIGNRSYLTA